MRKMENNIFIKFPLKKNVILFLYNSLFQFKIHSFIIHHNSDNDIINKDPSLLTILRCIGILKGKLWQKKRP